MSLTANGTVDLPSRDVGQACVEVKAGTQASEEVSRHTGEQMSRHPSR